ncbi:MAG: discoidin domain-containing protein [Gaiella sp.]|nr:discoidin domain-containing protein [Gaiella sp.]
MAANRFRIERLTRLAAGALVAIALTATAIGSAADQDFKVVVVSPTATVALTEPVRWEVTVAGLYPDRVEFAVDGNLQWTERYGPYRFNGDNGELNPSSLGPGSHTLRSVAYHGNRSAWTEITVSVPGPSDGGTDGASGTTATPSAPAPTPSTTSGLDLAAGKRTTSSSVESSELGPENAVDGDHSSRWSSAWKDGQWWQVDLGAPSLVDTVVVNWEAAYARSYTVQISGDGMSFTDVATVTIDTAGVRRTTFAPVDARYVRLLGVERATGYGISAWDIEVYGPEAGVSSPPADQGSTTPLPVSDAGRSGSPNPNLAAGKQTYASSTESDSLASRYAVDGSSSTRWSSTYADHQWWTVDLGSTMIVDRVVVNWEAAYAAKYAIQVADQLLSFRTVAQESARSAGPRETTFSSVSTRYVRILGKRRGTPYGFSAWEIEVYGPGATSAFQPAATVPAAIASPTITGALTSGSLLTTSTGTWEGGPTSFAYAWERCGAAGSSDCSAIAGATAQTYRLTSADVGATLRSKVTATNSGGAATASSAQTGVVQTSLSAPVLVALPAIQGPTVAGSSLTSTAGTWTGSPTSYAYTWLRCDAAGSACAPIAGATAQTYRLVSADVGRTLRARVTASNAAGSGTATSARTDIVAAAPTTPSNVGDSLPSRIGQSSGQHYYVNGQAGSDSNPGTISAPWRSIAKAWGSVPAGSVINVREGTYTSQTMLTSRSASASNPITLRAYPGESVTLSYSGGGGAAVYVANVTGLRIQGFTVANSAGDGIKVSSSSDVEIIANTIYGCARQGILVGGSGTSGQTYSRNVQIWSNRISNNGSHARYDHGIYYGNVDVDDSSRQRGAIDGVIANNVFYHGRTGYHLQIGPQANGLIVTNNTFTGATSSDPYSGSAIVIWGSGHQYSTKNVLVVNNALAYNTNKGVQASGNATDNTVRNNLAYANPGGDFAPTYDGNTLFTLTSNTTGTDPRFSDRTTNNYTPQDNSPLINHADPAYAPPTDINGRPRQGPPDIGAYEHQA